MAADLPSGVTAGTLSLAATTAYELGPLVQTQLDKNAAQSAILVSLQADGTNTAPILIGMNATVGTGSPVQYGLSLAAGADKQVGGGIQQSVLYGRWYVYSTATALLHIMVVS